MNTNISAVKKKYDAWRREHGSLRGLPLELQALGVKLLNKHAWSEVREQLGVSNSTLSKWRNSEPVKRIVERIGRQRKSRDMTRTLKKARDYSEFMELAAPMVGALPPKDQSHLSLKLQTPNGFSLRIEGPMDGRFVQGLAEVVCQVKTEVRP
jgi:hypothetical protein